MYLKIKFKPARITPTSREDVTLHICLNCLISSCVWFLVVLGFWGSFVLCQIACVCALNIVVAKPFVEISNPRMITFCREDLQEPDCTSHTEPPSSSFRSWDESKLNCSPYESGPTSGSSGADPWGSQPKARGLTKHSSC